MTYRSRRERTIRTRDRDAIIQSLRAGVVPRRGHHHVQVGRADEVEAVMRDLERVADGGSAIRFVIGEYGSGKTFFLFLVRSIALEKGLVTAHGDLAPDRRLHATGGQARALYAELMANLATRTKPDGGAVASVVERFVTSALKQARAEGTPVDDVVHERLEELSNLPGGYDFAEVVAAYWRGHETGDDGLQSDAVRWLRGEFTTKTDARKALGVRTIVDDDNVYERLKLFARFVRLAGYGGLVVAWTSWSTSTSWGAASPGATTTNSSCASSTTASRARASGSASFWGARPSSSWTRARASTATRRCARASKRTASPGAATRT